MKYFTKYLPVEGEIKEGDITFDGLLTYPISSERWKLIQRNSNLLTKLKKVKLFLCSRDIQVGDEMVVTSENCLWGKYGETCTLLEDFHKAGKCTVKAHNETIYRAHCDIAFAVQQGTVIKVIGEISKEATWIKEGQEFDEEQVCLFSQTGNGQWIEYAFSKAVLEGKKLSFPIPTEFQLKIKCPTCGTFH